ncbi:hypothetical protein J4E85_001024 [Alternaria conjuncta]|uniref:uncharacterized protein n=1 Tax=Alternaria conjuncta TaxID=181017 RepID=UPI00221F1F4B|nr:uncharacterized protein J4E85_001024 [Alternaria conjuncta]KAI4938583.1 hypothetical protein J4E85_001024 [Alternaria conjuncta]
MADSFDITPTSPSDWHPHQRAWIQLYYKLLCQTIRQYPSYPVCISDTAAFVGFSTFFEGSDSTGIIDREPAFGTRKAMFINHRNAAFPNLLSKLVEMYNNERTESSYRVSYPQVFITIPTLNKYIRISEQYGPDNDDPEPWKTQTDLWDFFAEMLAETFGDNGFLDNRDTVVQSFVQATEDNVAPWPPSPTDEERAQLKLLGQHIQRQLEADRSFISFTDRVSEESEQDHSELPSPTTEQAEKRTEQNVEKMSTKKASAWLEVERHALWRSINAWCHKNGIDAFDPKGMHIQTWNLFADQLNAECAKKGQVKQRTGDIVRSQVRDAVRRNNPPISELAKRAEDMREEIGNDKTKVFPQGVRFPEEAIKIPKNDAGAEDEE